MILPSRSQHLREAERLLGIQAEGRPDCGSANSVRRTGVICMLMCFAVGIANLFHVNWVIAFSIVCLSVFLRASMRHCADNHPQSMLIRHPLPGDTSAPSHLPDFAQI